LILEEEEGEEEEKKKRMGGWHRKRKMPLSRQVMRKVDRIDHGCDLKETPGLAWTQENVGSRI
jgi:hypothetical protein